MQRQVALLQSFLDSSFFAPSRFTQPNQIITNLADMHTLFVPDMRMLGAEYFSE